MGEPVDGKNAETIREAVASTPPEPTDGKAKRKRGRQPAQSSGARYVVTKEGLFHITKRGDGEEATTVRQRVAGPIKVVGLARTTEREEWSVVLEFRDLDEQMRQELIPRRVLLGDSMEGVRQLVDWGLFIEPGRRSTDLLREYIGGECPDTRVRLVSQVGWFEGAYVLPHTTIGKSTEPLLYRGDKRALRVFEPGGSLDDWRGTIGARASGNPRLIFTVAASLTGPLLHLCGGSSVGFHWAGDSSLGKSGALYAAASAWGHPRGTLHSWRHTDSALESRASQHNDGMLTIDEIGQVEPRHAGPIVYMIGNQKGKGRAHHAGGLREGQSWKLIMLSSGEIGLAEHMAAANQKARAGQDVRLIEMSADSGAYGMWNELHGEPDGGAFTNALRDFAGTHYGTAAPAFIERLTTCAAEVPAAVKAIESRFFDVFVPVEAAGQVRRVASSFALVAAAGSFAAEWGILPIEPAESLDAAGALFREWLAGRSTAGNLEEANILAHVREVIERTWQSKFIDWHRTREENADLSRMPQIVDPLGFRREVDPFDPSNPQYLFYVTRARFRDEFAAKAGFDHKRVAKLLKDRGILRCANNDGATWRETLPNGDRRSYVIIGAKLWEADIYA